MHEGPMSVLTILDIRILNIKLREIHLSKRKLENLKLLVIVVQVGQVFLPNTMFYPHWQGTGLKLVAEFQADLAWWEAFFPVWEYDEHSPPQWFRQLPSHQMNYHLLEVRIFENSSDSFLPIYIKHGKLHYSNLQ